MVSRRHFLATTVLSLPWILQAKQTRFGKLADAFANLEKAKGGRLGIAALNIGTGEHVLFRAGERFPMCSTFKFLLASAVLQRVDGHQEALDRIVKIPSMPLLFNSPLTEPNAGGAMNVAALCHAILTRSDNTAANLLLETIGGPQAVTKFCRSLGDPVTRLDRTELSLNECLEGDPRDTTSPSAMADNMQSVLLGEVLSRRSRNQLTLWMESNLTGLDRLRAKLPENWRVADKTGSNGKHTSNDIAAIWPPGKSPIIVAAFVTQCVGPEEKRAAILAEVGRLVMDSIV